MLAPNPAAKTVQLVLPETSMPGQYPQEGGGRLKNCFVESLGKSGPAPFKITRCPGLLEFGTTNETNGSFRGALQVGSNLYSVWSAKVNLHTSAGGAGTDLTNALTGTDLVFMAHNNASTPDLAIVSPDNGAFVATTTTVSAYPDADVGSPNSVCSILGYLVFSRGNGSMIATGLNSTSINTLDTATAESHPDTLYRVLSRGDTLIAAGSESIEFWRPNNEGSGFPFSFVHAHDGGIIHRYAIAGTEPGWNYNIFFVSDENTVKELSGYTSSKISPPDLDRLIEDVTDKETIVVSVYVTQGHPFVVVRAPTFCWEYDATLQRWHERTSYNLATWRGIRPFRAFDKWMCGASHDANLYELDKDTKTEDGIPMIWEVETGPQGNFPFGLRVTRLDLFFTGGVGVASGSDPIETNPRVNIFISKDLGLSWGNPWMREIGPQGTSPNVRVNNMGICKNKGVKFKFTGSDPVHLGLLGGSFVAIPLTN